MPYKNGSDAMENQRRYRQARREANGQGAPHAELMKPIRVKGPKHGLQIAVLPDGQVKPGVPIDHWKWCGEYLAEKKPDVLLCIGDFADMPSLSFHDAPGSLQLEGKRYKKDIESVHKAMELLLNPIDKVSGWNPVRIMLYGNHENRIERVINKDPKLQGLMSLEDLGYARYAWNTFPFLQPISINGVAFCHYFPSGVMGRPITSARGILSKLHMSAYAGHQQGRDIAFSRRADGKELTAIISGSFYQHHEDYLSPFTNQHWRGMHILHEVKDGTFDGMEVSINFLKRRFG